MWQRDQGRIPPPIKLDNKTRLSGMSLEVGEQRARAVGVTASPWLLPERTRRWISDLGMLLRRGREKAVTGLHEPYRYAGWVCRYTEDNLGMARE